MLARHLDRFVRLGGGLLALLTAGGTLGLPGPAQTFESPGEVALPSELVADDPACPQSIDPEAFTDQQTLRDWHDTMDRHGERATASPAHEQFIDWLDRGMRNLPGMEVSELPETIDRQLERSARLSIDAGEGGSQQLPVARAVPYSKPTPSGATGELVDLPVDEAISDHDVEGKVVLRDWEPGAIPMPVFLAVTYYVHDTGQTFDWTGDYERSWLAGAQLNNDLAEAQDGGAAGLLFVHEFPREQVEGDYIGYHGIHWDIPALYLGVDEGARLRDALAENDRVDAQVAVSASRTQAETRSLVGTLPGQSDERIVLTSHTDGTNAVWDNGPLAMLALARYYAQLPIECRPRTLEFVFTTAHLYLSQAGADRYAGQLDEEYGDGTVALVVVMEHLGANEFVAVDRDQGEPGRRLEPSGHSELFATFVSESPVLLGHFADQIVNHDLQRTVVLRGADEPWVRFPPHRSYGGEGTAYRHHIIPTVAAITGSWNLFSPAFETEDILDVELMRRQTLAFGDLVLEVDDVPREVLAGADNIYRPGRDLFGADPLSGLDDLGDPGADMPASTHEEPAGTLQQPWTCALHQIQSLRAKADRPGTLPTGKQHN